MKVNDKNNKKNKKSNFKKVVAWLHLWLGLASGIVVVIMAVTGCILVFEQEIKHITSPYLHVETQKSENLLPPSKIYDLVGKSFPGKEIHGLWYNGLDGTIKVDIESDSLIYVNPYTGKIAGVVSHEDFFHIVDDGHRYLWLEKEIGSQITAWATAIFFFLIISGLILWYPKKWNNTTINAGLKIKWKANFKRLNYDLHNVTGFYVTIIALLISFTGLLMSFHWLRESTYWVTGGWADEKVIEQKSSLAETDTATIYHAAMLTSADYLWKEVRTKIARENKEAIIIHFPDKPNEDFYVCTDMYRGVWRDLYFDSKTLNLLPKSQKNINQEPFSNWLMRSNYSLHTGGILGLPTKIIYFAVSLLCATLPITGFYIWWGKNKKRRSKF